MGAAGVWVAEGIGEVMKYSPELQDTLEWLEREIIKTTQEEFATSLGSARAILALRRKRLSFCYDLLAEGEDESQTQRHA